MKTAKMYRLQERHNKDIREILGEAFASGKSVDRIAADLDISRPCLYKWLDDLGLEVQHTHIRSLNPKRELVNA